MTHQNVLDSGIALIANWFARTPTEFLHVGTVHEFMLPRLEVNNPKLLTFTRPLLIVESTRRDALCHA